MVRAQTTRLARFALGVALLAAYSFAAGAPSAQNDAAENLTGVLTDPFASAHGLPVVLLFVRTDCPISNRYAPAIQKLSAEFNGRATFWLVYPDPAEGVPHIRQHLKDFHFTIPALRDVHHTLVKHAQVTITPEAAVFDGKSQLLYHGRIDNWYEDFGRSRPTPTTHELADAIRAAVNNQTPAIAHRDAVGCYLSDVK